MTFQNTERAQADQQKQHDHEFPALAPAPLLPLVASPSREEPQGDQGVLNNIVLKMRCGFNKV